MILRLLQKFETNRIFNGDEAWMLFRLAAIMEAFGWTLLLAAIACQHFVLPGNQAPVLIAGRIHGLLFGLYALAAVGLYPNLRWSRRQALVALLASVPPYGSLLFEQWAWHVHRQREFQMYGRCVTLAALVGRL